MTSCGPSLVLIATTVIVCAIDLADIETESHGVVFDSKTTALMVLVSLVDVRGQGR